MCWNGTEQKEDEQILTITIRLKRPMCGLPLSGFADARRTCCRTGTAKTRVYLCNPTTAGTCRNASSHVFFDGVHPSEAANAFVAESMIEAGIELIT